MAKAEAEVRTENLEAIKKQKRVFGHPIGLGVTSTMALAQAFGNYGMTAILIYYLYARVSEGGLGLTEANAAQLVNVYNTLVFMAALLGMLPTAFWASER